MRRFTQVDVFTDTLMLGNPLAVVHDADDLDDDQMAAFARWTNLSETTFLLRPTNSGADYRARIFTTTGELPFAGHPTLGSARAFAEATGRTGEQELVQECGAGLVRVRMDGERYSFAAPRRLISGPVDTDLQTVVRAALRLDEDDVVAMEWCDNGPGWLGVLVTDVADLRALHPQEASAAGVNLGVAALGGVADLEVRAFIADDGGVEDPVTGSLNAALGQWLIPAGLLPARYVAAQGSALRRRGRMIVEQLGDDIWVGGSTVVGVRGEVGL